MDTVRRRWQRLYPHIEVLGPNDDAPRPAVVLVHGCGGVRVHLRRYAAEAAKVGYRAFLVDSFGARGWSKQFAQYLVCSGLMLRGRRRAGDVLAALWGVRQWRGVDPDRLVLAGWSHGSWAIMDLMTMPLRRRGEAALADPDPTPLDGVGGAFLAYPYVGLVALSQSRFWLRTPRVFGVVARRDHLASVRRSMRAYAAAVGAGAEVELWGADATHAFDEPGIRAPVPITYDPDLSDAALDRFRRFLLERAGDGRPVVR